MKVLALTQIASILYRLQLPPSKACFMILISHGALGFQLDQGVWKGEKMQYIRLWAS